MKEKKKKGRKQTTACAIKHSISSLLLANLIKHGVIVVLLTTKEFHYKF